MTNNTVNTVDVVKLMNELMERGLNTKQIGFEVFISVTCGLIKTTADRGKVVDDIITETDNKIKTTDCWAEIAQQSEKYKEYIDLKKMYS